MNSIAEQNVRLKITSMMLSAEMGIHNIIGRNNEEQARLRHEVRVKSINSALYWLKAKHAIWMRKANLSWDEGKKEIACHLHEKGNAAIVVQWELERKQTEEGLV